ncbi:hypothetical protein MNEG_11699 [Monoraphidium neglectum]|uniref:Uncharacterized protein n=1 Tax=Monoraphidium neglectum TaxID=145388 RepID=A0A0D2KKD4_9CHLO|nr:hypothetical protein MNEG_11699 [Monoraphidium neglectum]KIY96263.1 hypothetical protein MNEG_11699 [Monoraphidium neglectum]|eukprot:XP_013895283.1 hypothetical protein MNEG_11699 [Monoraphidium neglectum]
MAFFKRLMDHVFNQVLVETLANSRWFQRFAVYSHKMSKEMAEKGKDGSKVLDQHIGTLASKAKETASKLQQDFMAELRKLQEAEAARQRQQGGKR